jgi:uncharacterized protein (DUF885 family)
VPQCLESAAVSLEAGGEVPTVWAEMAETLVLNAGHFLQVAVPALAPEDSSLAADLKKRADAAAAACVAYYQFIQERITERGKGSYALGQESLEKLIRSLHALDYDVDRISQIAEETIAETVSEIERLLADSYPDQGVSEAVKLIKDSAQADDDLLQAYSDEVKSLREFVLDEGLTTLPEDEELQVMHTPECSRATLPFAAYMPPAPFDERTCGTLWVTPLQLDSPPDILHQQRLEQNRHTRILISLHETYPGHHLQLTCAARHSSHARRLLFSPLFAEGWALYCEELLEETGYFSEIDTRIMRLVHQLIRACRVKIDVGLHTGQMTFTEAVDILDSVAGMDRFHAIAEVKRYTQTPAQPMSYLLGKLEIQKLRQRYADLRGAGFSLKEFHDHLLSFGSIPVSYISKLMMEQN